GLKQVAYNTTQARGEVLFFESAELQGYMDQKYAEKIRQEWVGQKITARCLQNLSSIASFTKVHEYVEKFWQVRYVDPNMLTIVFEVMIYNDVVAMSHTKQGDVFSVEIHNQQLADM